VARIVKAVVGHVSLGYARTSCHSAELPRARAKASLCGKLVGRQRNAQKAPPAALATWMPLPRVLERMMGVPHIAQSSPRAILRQICDAQPRSVPGRCQNSKKLLGVSGVHRFADGSVFTDFDPISAPLFRHPAPATRERQSRHQARRCDCP
jgi:hypothetical protein